MKLNSLRARRERCAPDAHKEPDESSHIDLTSILSNTQQSMKVDLGVFTKTKLVKDLHTHGGHGHGHTVCATESKNTHQGGVALFCKKEKDWHIEGAKTFGPNATGATLVSGGSRRRSVAGAHIPPSKENGKTLEWTELAADKLRRNPIFLLGDLSVDLLDARESRRGNRRRQATANVIELLGLKTDNHRFRRKMRCEVWTWWQRRMWAELSQQPLITLWPRKQTMSPAAG